MTLTVTGFFSGSLVWDYFPDTLLTVMSITPTTMKFSVPATAIATPGAFQVAVENFRSGWSGYAVWGYPTFLVEGKGPPVATPVFSPKAGKYTGSVNVTLSDAVAGAAIYYTTTGATPTTSSPQYTPGVPIVGMATEILKADATAPGYVRSAVATAKYTIV